MPVENRVWGLDRRSLPWALPVLGLIIVMAWVLPAIARAIPWDDPVEPGDVLFISQPADAFRIVFTPAVGWNIEQGVVVGEEPPTAARGIDPRVVDEGIAFSALTKPFVTAAGDKGLLVRYVSPTNDGVLAALVLDGNGVQVTVTGPAEQVDVEHAEDVAAMLVSIREEEVGS